MTDATRDLPGRDEAVHEANEAIANLADEATGLVCAAERKLHEVVGHAVLGSRHDDRLEDDSDVAVALIMRLRSVREALVRLIEGV